MHAIKTKGEVMKKQFNISKSIFMCLVILLPSLTMSMEKGERIFYGVMNKTDIPVTVAFGRLVEGKGIQDMASNHVVLKKLELEKDEKYGVYRNEFAAPPIVTQPKYNKFMLLIEKDPSASLGLKITEMEVTEE